MLKKTATKDLTPAQAQDALNEIAITGESSAGVTFEQAMELLEQANPDALQELTSEYFTFEKKDVVHHFMVLGLETAQIKGKNVEVVKLKDKSGNVNINGDKVLVSACRRLQQLPAYIRVVYTGDTKTAEGTYKNLTVKTFPIS